MIQNVKQIQIYGVVIKGIFKYVQGATYLFGGRSNTYNAGGGCFAIFNNSNDFDFQFGSNRNIITRNDNEITILTFSKNGIYINGNFKERPNQIDFETENPISIFAVASNSGSLMQYGNSQKLYLCEIYNRDNLLRNFIPCYSTSNVTNADGDECDAGTVGLYDLVEGKFYTNQGDKTKGDFIPGPEVN